MLRRALVLRVGSFLAGLLGILALSCAPGAPPDVRMRVSWSLSEPTATIPEGVDQLSIDIFQEGEEPINFFRTVEGLEDADGNGRAEVIRDGLVTGVETRLTITGLVGSTPRYVGHAGPFVLQAGERRYIDLVMYEIGASQGVERSTVRARFLHTATALPDGRVLIAGGFTMATRATSCPADLPAEARCHNLTAADDAWVFDPATALFHEVLGGMLEARGGHTATALPDGRVLIAGGASAALLVFTPQVSAMSFSVGIQPRDAADAPTASATFELFDPEANAEAEDVDADGDPGRGGFVGAADDPDAPGRLDRARFFAAAAAVPGTSRVVIAGGLGGVDPTVATTFTVFDAQRAGGYGVLTVDTPSLIAPRVAAGAAGVGSGASADVWIVGGTFATADAQLAEVWSATSSDPAGASVSASDAPLEFPQQTAGGTATHPEWNLIMPIVEPIDGGDHLLVAGWYGPLCTVGTTTPVFAGGADPTEMCGASPSSVRNFTIDVATGRAQPTPLAGAHAFGASARLDDGRLVITGGVSAISFTATNRIEVLTGDVDATGVATPSAAPAPMLRAARLFHTSTALPEGGVLTFGGLTFGALDLSSVSPVATPEVLYLP